MFRFVSDNLSGFDFVPPFYNLQINCIKICNFILKGKYVTPIKIPTQILRREMLHKKSARKMLVKLTQKLIFLNWSMSVVCLPKLLLLSLLWTCFDLQHTKWSHPWSKKIMTNYLKRWVILLISCESFDFQKFQKVNPTESGGRNGLKSLVFIWWYLWCTTQGTHQ